MRSPAEVVGHTIGNDELDPLAVRELLQRVHSGIRDLEAAVLRAMRDAPEHPVSPEDQEADRL